MGWAHRRGQVASRAVGYDYVHSAVDAFTRIAYSEILNAEDGPCCSGILKRAHDWFALHGVAIQRVLTDNGAGYRSFARRDLCAVLDVTHTRTRPYRPQTNGKVERFNRTLNDEWAASAFTAETATEPAPLTAGSVATTITAATPLSEAPPP